MPHITAFNLHDEYASNHACGFVQDLHIPNHMAANLDAALRGIAAVCCVLRAKSDALTLGDYIRGGLTDAIAMLANHAQGSLEHARDKAEA